MKQFIVISSNPTKTGNFVTKVQCKTEDQIFGKVKSETYYISGSKQLVPEATVSLNIERDWSITERETPFTDDKTGDPIKIKWLSIK